MGKKQDNLKIKNLLLTLLQHPSFKAKLLKTKNVTNIDERDCLFPLGALNPFPTHMSVRNRRKQGFDIFFDFNVISGAYSLDLVIGDKKCESLSLDDLIDIYKMSYNRIKTGMKKDKPENEFLSYLQKSLFTKNK